MPTFPPETLAFLSDLQANNNKGWFDANRARYERDYLAVGRAFHDALAARLGMPGKLMRIFRDVRFSKDKTPYKTTLDTWFTESEGWGPGVFVRLEPASLMVGMGCHQLDKDGLRKYRDAVVRDGDGLRRALGGATLGGDVLKRPPKGYPDDPLLLHTSVHVSETGPVPEDAVAHTLAVVERFTPVYTWLRGALG